MVHTDHIDHSEYAMPEDMREVLHGLIEGRLREFLRKAKDPGTDAGEEVGSDVGWERMPAVGREFHAQSMQDTAEQRDTKDRDPVATDD